MSKDKPKLLTPHQLAQQKESEIIEHVTDDVPDLMPEAFDIKILLANQHNWAGEQLKKELPNLCREIMDLLTSKGFVGKQIQSGAYFTTEDKEEPAKKVGGFDA